MIIGQRLKQLRKEKGFSQQYLGNLLGVTKVSICGYETGTRTPSLETFEMLADIFGTSTDYLLGREMTIINEDENSYVGSISEQDIEICRELKRNRELYKKIYEDPKRIITLINKKI